MKDRMIHIAFGILFVGLFSCKDFEPATIMITGDVIVTDSLVSAQTTLVDHIGEQLIQLGYCYSITPSPTIGDQTILVDKSIAIGESFYFRFRNFEANKAYFVRPFMELQDGIIYGDQFSFRTQLTSGQWIKLNPLPSVDTLNESLMFAIGGFHQGDPFIGGGTYLTAKPEDDKPTGKMTGPGTIPIIAHSNTNLTFKKYNSEEKQWRIFSSNPKSLFGNSVVQTSNFLYVGLGHEIEERAWHKIFRRRNPGPGNHDFYVFNGQTGDWITLEPFPGIIRMFATMFLVESKIFVIGGWASESTALQDVWVYDILLNQWTKRGDFPGSGNIGMASFVIGNNAYVGTGYTQLYLGPDVLNYDSLTPTNPTNEFWEYSTSDDSWTRIADFPGPPRGDASAISIGEYGYLGLGSEVSSLSNYNLNRFYRDFWRYDPEYDEWTQLPDFPGKARAGAVAFSNNSVGCVGLGRTAILEDLSLDIWIYDPSRN